MNTNEEEAERLMPMYQFLNRRFLYLLGVYHKWEDAEKQANFMIEHDVDGDFARDKLEIIRKMRENESNNQ